MEEGPVAANTTVLSPPNGDGGGAVGGPLSAIAALVQVCAN